MPNSDYTSVFCCYFILLISFALLALKGFYYYHYNL